MNPKLEKMILDARDALIHVGIASNAGGDVDSKVKGYIASLGPSLVNNGLLAAILIYEKEDTEKKKISQALHHLLTKELVIKCLSDYLLANPVNRNYGNLRKVSDYTIALKLALNLFHLKKSAQPDEQPAR